MNILTNPDIFSGLSKGQFLSKTGSCKTYDEEADGYCRGDGVVTLILKRLEDAVAEKDPILGVICGTATNHSAEAVSITHPHIGAQKFLFQKVMDEAGVDVRDVDYVEMHGTGTQAGDGVEMESVSGVFAPRPSARRRGPGQPLFVGSVKSNIGHGEAVSGVSALAKILLMFKKNTIPPHCGIKGKINQRFPPDLKERNLNIAFEPKRFPRTRNGKDGRTAFLNNFSAAGGNTALLLQDGPLKASPDEDPRRTKIVTVSAKSLKSFRSNLQNLLSWVNSQKDLDLSSVAYSTTARRVHYNYRVAINVQNVDQLSQKLEALTDVTHVPISSTIPKVAFVFTGQGSQYSGMGKELYSSSAEFRTEIDNMDRLAVIQGFTSFIDLIRGSGSIENMSPVSVQLGIVCLEIALSHLWQSWGAQPVVVIGHSLGEYAI